MKLELVHSGDHPSPDDDPHRTLVEVARVAAELRGLIEECRQSEAALNGLTAVEIAQAKALLAEARSRLARARRRLAQ